MVMSVGTVSIAFFDVESPSQKLVALFPEI